MSLLLILLTCALSGATILALALWNVFAGILALYPVMKLCDWTCKKIDARERNKLIAGLYGKRN